jgi:predicted amidohydrolase
MEPMTLRIAAAAWKIRFQRHMRGDSDYFGHLHDFVTLAHDGKAQVLVLPELHVLELLHLQPKVSERNAAKYLAQYAPAIEQWIDRISDLSGLVIVGGSYFKETPDGIKNVCATGIPGGATIFSEKNNLTRYEQDVWEITPGKGLARLPHSMGVTICYDAEFPEAARALAEQNMLVQCVPSWTETQRGFQRVRWSCLARAIENTTFVVQSVLIGDLEREPVPASFGSAAIMAPSIEPFPEQAILGETPMNQEGIVIADLDLNDLMKARSTGEVRNWQDRNQGTWSVTAEPRTPDTPINLGGELN